MSHLAPEDLLAYYLGEPVELDPVEEHLFECAACGAKLEAIHRTAFAVVAAVRGGEIAAVGTTALLNRMSRDRLNVRHYLIEPGETVACSVSADDHFMAGRVVLPAGDFGRVDLRVLDAGHNERWRLDDIVIDRRHRHAILFIPARPVLAEDSAVTHYVLIAGDRELGTYSMDHTALRDG